MKPSTLRYKNHRAEAYMRAIDFYNLKIEGNPYPVEDKRHRHFNYFKFSYRHFIDELPDGLNRYNMTLEHEPIVPYEELHTKQYYSRVGNV